MTHRIIYPPRATTPLAMVLLLLLGLAVPPSAWSESATQEQKIEVKSSSHALPGARRTFISYDRKYIYWTRPVRLKLDIEQRQAFSLAVQLVENNISKFLSNNKDSPTITDPNGDLEALAGVNRKWSEDLDRILTLADETFDTWPNSQPGWGQWLVNSLTPSGFMVFMAAEYDKSLRPLSVVGLDAGGSVTLAVVLLPIEVVRAELRDPKNTKKTYLSVDTSVVLMPNVNLGGGGGSKNGRVGFGVIWGPLNRASDFGGLSGAISMTLQKSLVPHYLRPGFADAVNIKLAAVRNLARADAPTNYFTMFGYEIGEQPASPDAKIASINFEAHLNLSGVFGINQFFAIPEYVSRWADNIIPGGK